MKKQPSDYSLKKSTEHLFYEIQMFNVVGKLLQSSNNQVNTNILLDCFAIHARNLYDFFYPKAINLIKSDDMIFTDFYIDIKKFNRNKTPRKYLSIITKKTDKQVAHLTYRRNKFTRKTKPWHFLDICKNMNITINAFYLSLPSKIQNWTYVKDIKNHLLL